MSGGFGAGFFRGLLVSALAAGALSLASPLTPPDPGKTSQVDLTTPAGSGFNAARRDTNPVLPKTDQTVAKDNIPAPEIQPDSPRAPIADTAPTKQPSAQGNIAPLPKAPAARPERLALSTPSGDSAPRRTGGGAPAALGVPMPKIDNPVGRVPSEPVRTLDQAPTTKVTAPPTLARDGSSSGQTQAGPNAAPAAAPGNASNPAANAAGIRQNAVPFHNPKAKPLFSIILIDAGKAGLDDEVLRTFTIPITFALDAADPATTARAKRFHAAGFEVLTLAPKALTASTATAETIDKTLTGALVRLPETVGLLDRPGAQLRQKATLEDQVIARLKTAGLGLLTYDIGVNGTDQKARHAGLASGTVYRILDSQRESGPVIKRYLNRAVLEAEQTGHVVVVGHTYPETVTALFSWAVGSRSSDVALAPVSAVLLAR